MTIQMILFLMGIGLFGGAWNALAGGATLFTFPALMAAGLPPVVANATNYLALLPSNAAALPAYRRELTGVGFTVVPLLVVSGIGAIVGSLLLLVSGEERGLLGSAYYAENPPLPIERTVANLNADMVGRNWSDTIVVIGQEHSDLGETLQAVAEAHPELNMAPIGDLWPEQNFYGRSDHFNFARRGVPILFFFNGTHEDYHRPSDEIEKIDGEKAARIGRLMFYLGLEVSQRPEPPKWDRDSRRQIVTGG